jgi:peptide-methionine (R)-S-oxide reductase
MSFPIEKSVDEWRSELSSDQFAVLREAATEPAFTGALLHVDGQGSFACGGCHQILFTTSQKFDSGCGWPSFDECIPGTILERRDATLGMIRTEILCSQCGGHLGHVFNDGPTESGLRYCVNSLAIEFETENEG